MINAIFSPHDVPEETRHALARALINFVDRAHQVPVDKWVLSDSSQRMIKAVLMFAGFNVVAIDKGLMKNRDGSILNPRSGLLISTQYFGNNSQDGRATQWLSDLFDYVRHEIGSLSIGNMDRLIEVVLEKLELVMPLRPILVAKKDEAGVKDDVLMELPVSPREKGEYPWFVKHPKWDDEVPEVGEFIGVHGPVCGGLFRRSAKGDGKEMGSAICKKCKFTFTVPKYALSFRELNEGLRTTFKTFRPNQNKQRNGPRPHMRKGNKKAPQDSKSSKAKWAALLKVIR